MADEFDLRVRTWMAPDHLPPGRIPGCGHPLYGELAGVARLNRRPSARARRAGPAGSPAGAPPRKNRHCTCPPSPNRWRSCSGTAAPEHVRDVRLLALDALTDEQLAQLGEISRAIIARLITD